MKRGLRMGLTLCLLAIAALPFTSAATFQLQPGTNRSLCLTVPNNSGASPQVLQFATCNATNTYQQLNEIFGVTVLQFITGLSSDNNFKCLDSVNGTANGPNGIRVTQQSCSPATLTQYWTQPTTLPPGGALLSANWIRNFVTNRCMTAESGGAYIDNYDCTNNAFHQLWTIGANDFSVGGSPIRNALYGNCLEIVGGNPNVGASTDAGICSSTAWYQHFYVVYKTVEMLNFTGSGKCVDGGSNVTPVYQYDCTPTASNQWWLKVSYFNETTASGFYWVDMRSGFCLTWDPTNPNNVYSTPCVMGNTNQQFMPWYL